jgi:recombination protein RecT
MTTQQLKSIATGEAQQQRVAEMKPKEQIAYLLKQKSGEIAKMLPKHLNAERLLKVAQIAATTTPALAKCDVASLVGAIGQCAQMGLEPNTVLGHAYLVPFNTKRKDASGGERWVNSVQVIIGYKGLIDLARRSGQIVSIAAHEVCQADKFDLVYGLDEKLNHTPAMGDRGEVIGFYAVAKLKDGGHCFEFMSRHQVEAIRDGSQGYQQAKKYGKESAHPWSAHFVEMGRKTVIRRLAKFLPLSVEFQTGVALDSMASAGKDQHNDAMDGDYSLLPDDAPEELDTDTGEITQLEHQQPVTVPQHVEPPKESEEVIAARAAKIAALNQEADERDRLKRDAGDTPPIRP